MIDVFRETGLNVIEINNQNNSRELNDNDRLTIISKMITEFKPLFVFGINYFPIIADICRIYNVPYLSQTVDSPILTLFSDTIKYPTNRIFMFDREQYNYFRPFNPACIYHLPLASAVNRFDKVVSSISSHDRNRFASDISFVGSTYREKDPYKEIKGLSDYTRGYISGLIESCQLIYGYYPIKNLISHEIIDDFKTCLGNDFPSAENIVTPSDAYVISHEYIGSHLAVEERERTLNALAEHFSVDLYTASDTSTLRNVRIHDAISTLDEMPKVFNLSRINLNITVRSIESGLPLRCFDILGCGGFLMTNYQPEIEDMFIIGEDLETYSSIGELIDKCRFYLSHEDKRVSIARNGYEKVKASHMHIHRLNAMLKTII